MLDDFGSIGSTIVLIVLMLLVLFAAYYTTKLLSTKTQRLTRGKHLQIVDRIMVGGGKTILLVSAGEKVFLVGVTNQQISMLGTMDHSGITPITEEMQPSVISSFTGVYQKLGELINRTVKAPDALRQARAQARPQSRGRANQEADMLGQMIDSLQQRNSRRSGGQGEDIQP